MAVSSTGATAGAFSVDGVVSSAKLLLNNKLALKQMPMANFIFIKSSDKNFARSPRFILDVQDKSWTPINYGIFIIKEMGISLNTILPVSIMR
ncbi:hypothetical protein THIOM_002995 [Candidatus Thiomargarita nelsonii]|uniref:Uncharacterized protein n=1 Tax=Candidatus Thiomargarita nelsonii TaxID=1003181 RepID=A0A176RZV4_9GAMM|nr:hypothetical protein THIOM_002995 [Candidatus Thiomargarita nelsonii]